MKSNGLFKLFVSFAFVISLAANDEAVFKTCNPSIPAEIRWSPYTLVTGIDYSITFTYNGPERNLSDINICVKVWVVGDDEPLYDDCETHECQEYLKYLQIFQPNAGCPWRLSKGKVNAKKFLDYTIPTLEGDFEIFFEITDLKTEDVVLCLRGFFTMIE